MKLRLVAFFAVALSMGCPASAQEKSHYDICVYGGTSAGVIAAVQAKKEGCSVVLVSPDKHLGGLTSGGLGFSDMGNVKILGGLTRDYFHRVLEHYDNDADAWTFEKKSEWPNKGQGGPAFERTMQVATVFEPHAAEKVFDQMIAENKVEVVHGRIDLSKGVEKSGAHLRAMILEGGKKIAADEFIDATYEGDLMAKAGVSYTVGRESNAQYGETYNGITSESEKMPDIDAYVKPGDPASGLLPRVHPDRGGNPGDGDKKVQAYCYRVCLTTIPANMVPIPKPPDYRDEDYEIILRAVEAGQKDHYFKLTYVPNRKLDGNNNAAISMDFVGMNWAYPDAGYAEREKIAASIKNWQCGVIWTLQNNPRVPAELRDYYKTWGLAKDEFADNANWPYALYVREARRMVSPYVITQNVAEAREIPTEPIAVGTYSIDSHHAQYYVNAEGKIRTDGGMSHHLNEPYGIDYRAITPPPAQCDNLLVPICLSATHAAYGSARMEPVFMNLGQSAATAAAMALKEKIAVQKVDYAKLRERLLADGQVIEKWK